jgi:hypothetical protein
MLTLKRLKALLIYDPETGVFYWAAHRGGLARVGSVAGTNGAQGYTHIRVDGRQHRAHRLAWLYVHGYWPSDQIDHVNGVRSDNRISNLREASNAENQQNTRRTRTCSSGAIGIDWCKKSRKWRARIRHNKSLIHVGLYNLLEDAVAARAEAKKRLHTFSPIQK